ncbi:hypothetical protein RND81_12G094900 [Saponaria officinalis]|uniref:Uncharacterized protein n=1 Tax=Saponaria officinalis TaxID=3572 RepID=A0AAW1H8G3_SAPOF
MLSTACLLTPIHPCHSHIPFYLDISCLLSHELLHCIGGEDIDRKIVLISSCLMANMDSTFRKYLLDAADRCVSVEFVFLEQNSNQLSDFSDSVNKFRGQICDLENCSFNTYLPDGLVFNGLVKRWVGELTTDDIMQWQAHLVFQRSLAYSINEIFCKLCNSSNYIMDVFNPCKGWQRLPNVRSHFLCYDGNVDQKSMKVDEHTLLSKESWRSWISHCPVSSAVYLNVTERTNLASVNECVMVGKPYIVIPSDSMETDTTDESDKCQLNNSRAFLLQHSNFSCHNTYPSYISMFSKGFVMHSTNRTKGWYAGHLATLRL